MKISSLLNLRVPIIIAAIFCQAGTIATKAAIANVAVINNAFSPTSTNIFVNDSVVWTWGTGSLDHNVTSTSLPKAWTWTASIDTDAPFIFTNKFTKSGSYPYVCTVHASVGMLATVTVSNAPNVPPSVTLTSPSSGTVFRAPGNVTMQATTSDSDATVTNVQFLVGASVVSNVVTAPFAATTNNLAAGSYTLSAVATDTVGLKNTNSVSIIVDAPPAVTITNPASGSVWSTPASVTIQASASSSGGTVANVEFLVGSTVVSNRTASPYAATTNLTAGSYTLFAIATDNNGITTTNSVPFNVVTPVANTMSSAKYSSSGFQFSYVANVGLSYVVQKTTNLTTLVWVPQSTNQAAATPVIFSDTHATNGQSFYRVGRMPNP